MLGQFEELPPGTTDAGTTVDVRARAKLACEAWCDGHWRAAQTCDLLLNFDFVLAKVQQRMSSGSRH